MFLQPFNSVKVRLIKGSSNSANFVKYMANAHYEIFKYEFRNALTTLCELLSPIDGVDES